MMLLLLLRSRGGGDAVIVAIYQYFRVVKHKKQITKTFEGYGKWWLEKITTKRYTPLCYASDLLTLSCGLCHLQLGEGGKGREGGKKGREGNESAPDRMAGLRWPVAWLNNASGGQIIIMVVEEQAVRATGPWPASWNMQRPKAKY
jgi:hypothetical protein